MSDYPRDGWVQLDGWGSRTQQRVLVIGETPKRYRIRAITSTRLAGRYRLLGPGHEYLVPKAALTFHEIPGVAMLS